MRDQSWILKILSGTHVGAEVVLSDKESVLGRDENCDLVLDDVSLSAQHISLRTAASGAHLTLLDTSKPIYIDGEECAEKETLLKPFQVITIGTLFLAVGPADEEWPAIDLLLENKITPPPSDDTQANSDTAAAESDKNATVLSGPMQQKPVAKKTFPWIYLTVIGIPIVALSALLTSWILLSEAPEQTAAQPQQAEQIMQLAKKYHASINIQATDAKGNPSEITGYVGTETSRKQLLEQLERIGVQAHVKILSSEKIESAISTVVNKFLDHGKDEHVEVTVVADAPGDFILRGYVSDKTEWLKIVTTLKRDVSGYRNLKDEVQTQEDRVKVLQEMLNDAQLGRQVSIAETEEKGLVLSGKLNQEEKERLMQVKQAFNRKFNAQPEAVWVFEKAEQEPSPSIKLDIRGIRFGGNPQIITHDGQHYSKGSQLDSGYTISNITTKFVVLKKGDKVEYLHLNAIR